MFTKYILDTFFIYSSINAMPRGGGMGRPGVGRVLLHERNTGDAPILGGDLSVGAAHRNAVRNTEKKQHYERYAHGPSSLYQAFLYVLG